MRQSERVSFAKMITEDLELAELTRTLMSGVRTIYETDKETLRRVVEEYKDAKYRGKEIPKER